MPGECVHRLTHTAEVAAPAPVVYALIADPERWPLFLPRTVYAQRLDFDGVNERLRVWSLADGQVASWISHRVQDAVGRCITFRQGPLMAPATSMTGRWSVRALEGGRCRLTLEHEFTAARERPQDAVWLGEVTADNSRSALRSLQFVAERWARLEQLALSFAETVRVKGPPELVYDFLYDVADWPGQLPHVRRAVVEVPQAGIQKVALDLTAPGSPHTAPDSPRTRLDSPRAGLDGPRTDFGGPGPAPDGPAPGSPHTAPDSPRTGLGGPGPAPDDPAPDGPVSAGLGCGPGAGVGVTVAGIRICFPHAGRIVHKATVPRPLLAAHCGEWSVLPDERGVTVVAQHHVILREDRVEQVLGAGTTLAEARRQVRAELGRDSRQTLQLARRHAESAIRVL
ncbi:SRPBCC family protein [Streptomyces sp. NPDC050732]|uniref:aromatase/cyclase n=1 Tax=Streptomyces sp. NPDC050732 TaxID=3154632 RepID=UPI003431838B